jgi:hypothetical protein
MRPRIEGVGLGLVAALLAIALAASASATRAASAGATAPPGDHNEVPSGVQDLADKLVEDLGKNYEVAQGYAKLYTKEDCDKYSFPVMKNCFGNNPAAPYVLAVVPSWPDEFVDPATQNAFGKTDDGYSVSYRFDPQEAILVFGVLPPPSRYMGLQSYLFSQEGSVDTSSPTYQFTNTDIPFMLDFFFGPYPQNPGRIVSFSSLSNAINDVVIERQSGASFGSKRFFISTPDQGMDTAVREALQRLSVKKSHVLTEPIPPLGSPLGLDAGADDFVTGIRYALPEDEKAGDAWRRNLPLVVMRIREPASSGRTAEPYPPLVLDSRTAVPEAALTPDLDNLANAVCERWQQCPGEPKSMLDLQAPPINLVGPECREIGMDCLGDSQDATYRGFGNFRLDSGQVYAIVGTLGTETGNATYEAIGINESSKFAGVANVNDPALRGTADEYAQSVANTNKLFVYYVTRKCKGLEKLTNGHCLSVSKSMVPEGGAMKLTVREYIRPGTERGPDSTQILRPHILTFERPSPS